MRLLSVLFLFFFIGFGQSIDYSRPCQDMVLGFGGLYSPAFLALGWNITAECVVSAPIYLNRGASAESNITCGSMIPPNEICNANCTCIEGNRQSRFFNGPGPCNCPQNHTVVGNIFFYLNFCKKTYTAVVDLEIFYNFKVTNWPNPIQKRRTTDKIVALTPGIGTIVAGDVVLVEVTLDTATGFNASGFQFGLEIAFVWDLPDGIPNTTGLLSYFSNTQARISSKIDGSSIQFLQIRESMCNESFSTQQSFPLIANAQKWISMPFCNNCTVILEFVGIITLLKNEKVITCDVQKCTCDNSWTDACEFRLQVVVGGQNFSADEYNPDHAYVQSFVALTIPFSVSVNLDGFSSTNLIGRRRSDDTMTVNVLSGQNSTLLSSPRNTTTHSTTSPQLSASSDSDSTPTLSTLAIVGIAVGGAAFLLLLYFVRRCYLIKRQG